ncbi:MAG: hypothetical protein JSV99_05480 [Planctomycetota bacterium]|nr:MAG: hypothetical protein JSV99_05480 [Planctomycetota bacterium]
MSLLRRRSGSGRIVVLGVVLVCALCSGAFGQPWDGSGDANDPYQIWDANDMQAIGANPNDWDKDFKLMADIDLSDYTGDEFNVIGIDSSDPFTGTFDGNGRTISNFTYSSTSVRYIGIFGYIYGSNAEIKDLHLIDPNVSIGTASYTYIGALAGLLYNGKVTGCCVEGGTISGHYRVGGLLGVKGGTVENCHSSANVSGDWRVGGLMGTNSGSTINCTSSGAVSGTEEVGGLVGWNGNGTINQCVSTCAVSGQSNVGGLVGHNDVTICDSYSACSVDGRDHVGGLVGFNELGTVANCHSAGNVTGSAYYVGGLAGLNDGTISECTSSALVAGDDSVGGLVGHNREGTASNCYAVGDVTGSGIYIGGLVGQNYPVIVGPLTLSSELNGYNHFKMLTEGNGNGTLSKCYSTGWVWGDDYVGGLVGRNNLGGMILDSFWDVNSSGTDTSDGGTGLTTTEMQTRSTFTDAGWDFVGEVINGPNDIWHICEGTNYPKFAWQIPAGDLACPDGVTLVDFSVLGTAWYSGPGDGNWDPNCDISEPNDNLIDERDLRVFVGNYLEGIL